MDYIEYLALPTKAVIIFAVVFLILQIVGEILEVKGKVVPEVLKIRKFFSRKKQERKARAETPKTLEKVTKLLDEVNAHYSADNITQRNGWMTGVNHHLEELDSWKTSFCEKMDAINEIVQEMQINGMRQEVINFAAVVADETRPVSQEQFKQAFRSYDRYEALLKKLDMTNGQAEASIRIIREAYQVRCHDHTFLENLRGYDITD